MGKQRLWVPCSLWDGARVRGKIGETEKKTEQRATSKGKVKLKRTKPQGNS